MYEHFQSLLSFLAVQHDAQLEYAEDGKDVSFVADGFYVMCSFLEGTEQMLLSTCVAEIPETDRQALYFKLLNGQYFFRETGGATLAVDGEEKFVSLQIVRDLRTLTPERFAAILDNFLTAASLWRGRVDGHSAEEKRKPDLPEAALPDPGMMIRV